MPDVGTCTSPRLLKRHVELLDAHKSPTPRAPSMLGLPLELVTQILDATMIHPEEEEPAREQLEDPRSHGWRSPVKASTLATRTTAYHRQLLDLLLVCRTFYRHLLPKLYDSPLLLTPSSIEAFTSLASQFPSISPSHSQSTFGSLTTALSIQPLTTTPSPVILQAWLQHLPTLLAHCTRLSTLSLGVAARTIPSTALHAFVSALPLHNNLESLSMLDLYAEPDPDARARQDAVISLISRAPSLRSISLSGMNLLEENHAHARDSGMDDVPALDARDSVLERFLGALKLGGSGGSAGVEKLFMWQNTAMGVGGFSELLDALPELRCLHLDVWSFIATSQRKTSFYDPLSHTFSLSSLAQRFSHLTELSFAPSFSSSITRSGNLDSILLTAPHLRCLELRADHITPDFFSTFLALPPSHPIFYVGVHVFPSHAPPTIDDSTGTSIPTVTVFVYIGKTQIIEVAQVVVEACGGELWPTGGMEGDSAGVGWHEMLQRVGAMTGRKMVG